MPNRNDEIYSILSSHYAHAHCELVYSSPFELLIAVILSAQCTDKRVNLVTAKLFKQANTPMQFAVMPVEELEQHIFSCGFYRNKAKSIISASRDIIERFNGQVPSTLADLMSLKGVGRKTANVVLNTIYDMDTVAVDTHVFRVANRLGLSKATTPYKVEQDLTQLFTTEQRYNLHHLMIFHGRYCCHSQRPDCTQCPLKAYCVYI